VPNHSKTLADKLAYQNHIQVQRSKAINMLTDDRELIMNNGSERA